jgi:TRAP-type C4-dicarboxylate transport system permease small subunit
MKFLNWALDRVFAALTWFALALLGIMTALIFADVFCRYVLGFSIAWADEITLILMIWYVFIALAVGVRRKAHSSIDLLHLIFHHATVDRIAQRIVSLLVFGFGGLLIYFGVELIRIGAYSTLASIDIPSYVEYLFIPVSGALVMGSTVADALRRPSAEPEVDYLDRVFMNKAGRHV